MAIKKTIKVSFQHNINNAPRRFEGNVEVRYHVDPHYMADADNKRGIEKLFIDDFTVLSLIDEECRVVDQKDITDAMLDDILIKVTEDLVA